ncbi:PmeII family type II restriction endonuclease [Geitlerinema splendidum]|nr:PmeII family type II restriction endonuclease [Geitlerinema splendidum]
MNPPLITPQELEELVKQRLEVFYERRIRKLTGLNLWETLRRKNPYLFRAIGMQKAAEIVEELLKAYMSSSDEGIFGDAFFEPIAKAVGGGVATDSIGIDAVIETPTTYTVVQVKSGPNWGNADQRRRLKDNFENAHNTFLDRQLDREFRALLGQCYGRENKDPTESRPYFTRSGQAFWQELTGDPDFYLRLIHLMQDYPLQHRLEFQKAWSQAVNRFELEFLQNFSTPEGDIDWEKLVKVNSGEESLKKTRRRNH